MNQPWTGADLAFMREHYRSMPARDIAAALGRSRRAIYSAAKVHGLTAVGIRRGTSLDADVRRLHALGWCDREIADHLHCCRHLVSVIRGRLGLSLNSHVNASQHMRDRARAKTAAQLAQAGLRSLAEVRDAAFRRYARQCGWPDDLRPRAVQILNLLKREGPKTRQQIAAAIGMPWKGSRKSLVSNDPEGSYLAHLTARGLVMSLGRVIRGSGRGKSTCVYSLTLEAELKHGKFDNDSNHAGAPAATKTLRDGQPQRRRRLDDRAAPGSV